MRASVAVHIIETVWKIGAILLRMGMGRAVAERNGVLGRVARTVALGLWLAGCSVEEAGAGEDCVRSTECEMGLLCIEGVCSNDLSLIGDPGEVPELMPDGGMDMAMPDAGEPAPVDAGGTMVLPDAGEVMMMAGDAATPAPDGG